MTISLIQYSAEYAAPAAGGGGVETPDLSDLYQLVITRNDRLKRLVGLRAPEIILRNERRMLRVALDSLFSAGEVEEIVAHVGAALFLQYFNHIAGTAIDVPAPEAAAASRAA